MTRLAANHNLYNTCLNLLREAGFEPSIHRDDDGVGLEDCIWCAEQGGYDLVAGNPIELLGLISIVRARAPSAPCAPKPYWWVRAEDRNVFDELVDEAYPEDRGTT